MPRSEPHRRSHKPWKVLYVITDLDVGGAEQCCAALAMRLDRSRWSPEVCCLTRAGALAGRLTASGIPVHALDAGSYWRAPAVLLRLVRLMGQVRPALVHTFLLHANTVGRLAARLAGVRRVISSIRVAERRYRHHLVLENLTCRLADRVVCVSDAVARFVRRRSHVPAARLVVVPNGVEAGAVARTPPAARSSLGVPDDAIVALYVGRLDPQKGVDVLLRAIAAARTDAPQLHLVLAGTGPQHHPLIALAAELGLQQCTHFLGWRDDVPSLMRGADFFVLPSRWEGMPNVVLEAMAAGLPVVATRTEGTTELVQNGETGLLVEIDDSPALAQAMVRVAGNREPRIEWGSRGQQLVRREFSLDRMIERYEQLYEAVISSVYASAVAATGRLTRLCGPFFTTFR